MSLPILDRGSTSMVKNGFSSNVIGLWNSSAAASFKLLVPLEFVKWLEVLASAVRIRPSVAQNFTFKKRGKNSKINQDF